MLVEIEIWWIFVMNLRACVLPLLYTHMHTHMRAHTHMHTGGREANCEVHWVMYSYVPGKFTPVWSTHMHI